MIVAAEVLEAVERADNLAQATGDALDIAACAVLAGSADAYRELEKVRELHRIALSPEGTRAPAGPRTPRGEAVSAAPVRFRVVGDRDRLLALAHAIEPLMMLAVDAEQASPTDDKITIDGLLRIRLQLTRYQLWLFDRADGASR